MKQQIAKTCVAIFVVVAIAASIVSGIQESKILAQQNTEISQVNKKALKIK